MVKQYDVGILGGGQLARMLAHSGQKMGLSVQVLCQSEDDPAAQVATHTTLDHWQASKPAFKTFLKNSRRLTFESEFVDPILLKPAAKKVWPEPKVMQSLRDRYLQKSLLDKHGLPTAPWEKVHETLAQSQLSRLLNKWGALVVKKRLFGYDGYGTFVISTETELAAFLKGPFQNSQVGFIVERYIPFQRELAVMVGRSTLNETVSLPVVETFQKNSRCLWVRGPIEGFARLQAQLELFISEIKYVGLLGVEIFETEQGPLINELAPRVHNSGHYSQDALNIDQFELHLRCMMGLPLPRILLRAEGFAMWNLLGQKSPFSVDRLKKFDRNLGSLHWYGKKEERPGRKMGHVNSLGSSPLQAWKRAKKAALSMGY